MNLFPMNGFSYHKEIWGFILSDQDKLNNQIINEKLDTNSLLERREQLSLRIQLVCIEAVRKLIVDLC